MKKKLAMIGIFCCLMAVSFSFEKTALADMLFAVENEEQLKEVFDTLNADGGEAEVQLQQDITLTSPLSLENGTLTILGEETTITGEFILSGTAELNLGTEEEVHTLQITSANNTSSIFDVDDSAVLNIYEGTTLGPSAATGMAGGIQAHGVSKINLYGGTIRDCKNQFSISGGVYIEENAVFTMYDGLIENCYGLQGGAVGIAGGMPIGSTDGSKIYATFHMLGGTIQNCDDGWYGGGAVCIYTNTAARFIMDGGTITGCGATNNGYGGAVFVYSTHDEALVQLNEGTITGNESKYGGGVFVFQGKTEIADGFCLYDNYAALAGDDIYNNGCEDVTLGSLPAGLFLQSCGDAVDAWYDDDSANRWNVAACSGTGTDYAQKVDISSIDPAEGYALKAAHGNSFQIIFEAGSHGTFSGDATVEYTCKKGDPFPAIPTPSAVGQYVFDGWYENGKKVTDFPAVVSGSAVYTAGWTAAKPTYTVSFDTDGGNSIPDQQVAEGDQVQQPADPVKNGYTFQGWSWNGKAYDFSQPVYESMTLTALWTRNTSSSEENDSEESGFDIIIEKTDDEGNPLPGAVFRLTDSRGNELEEAASNHAGIAKIRNIFGGTYILQEIKAPDGYQIDETPMTLRITQNKLYVDGERCSRVTVVNEPLLNRKDHIAFLTGYEDGSFRAERYMTRGEVATMFSHLMEEKMDHTQVYSASFSDVTEEHWAANYIGFMEKFDIINGYPEGTFRPDAPITRSEFAALVCRFEMLTEGSLTFFDVPEDHWAKDYITFAAERGWLGGYPDGSFRPEQFIKRAEVASVTCRLLERSADRDYINQNLQTLSHTFWDVAETHWAYWEILEATNTHDYYKDKDNEIWLEND